MSGKSSKGQRPIGGVSDQRERYGTLGGRRGPEGTQPSIQQANSPTIQQLSSLRDQQSSSSVVQQSESSEGQSVKMSKAQKSKGERTQLTVYVPRSLAKWVRIRAAEEEREISEIATDAFEMYRENRG